MENQEEVRRCPRCGARNAPEAQFCGDCGQLLLENGSTAPEKSWLPTLSATDALQEHLPSLLPVEDTGASREPSGAGASARGEESATAPLAPEGQVAQKRCGWCSELNPWAAAACQHCGAHFPIPEQDEAFRRAAEERMRQDVESLNFWSLHRRRGWRRFWI